MNKRTGVYGPECIIGQNEEGYVFMKAIGICSPRIDLNPDDVPSERPAVEYRGATIEVPRCLTAEQFLDIIKNHGD